MKTQQQWFDEYAISHQNETNQAIHYICVPLIYFTIIGMLMSINTTFLQNLFNLNMPILENWAVIVAILLMIFYLTLSFKTFMQLLLFTVACIVGNYYLGTVAPLFYTSLILFVLAWIGQFYGHKIEGKKPSFLKDLQFLLIGPAWVFKKMFG